MGRPPIDLTGNRFGSLVAREIVGRDSYGVKWLCDCDCGNTHVATSAYLRRGSVQSCGCTRHEGHAQALTTHGQTDSPAWQSWRAMKSRCLNFQSKDFKRWGGRGIKICDEWMDFNNFYSDMGDRPEGTTLDRIDVNGNYEASNCRWATPKQQQNNKRNSNKLLA